MSTRLRTAGLPAVALLVALGATQADAQFIPYYGKNKVAYDSFSWPPARRGWPVSFFVVTLIFLGYVTAQLAGPGMAGGLIQWIGAPLAIIADAFSYIGSALFVFLIRRAEPPVESHEPGTRPKIRTEVAQGLRYVLGQPLLRAIAACTASSNLFSQIGFGIFILYAVRGLDLNPGQIGLIFAIGNVGALLGALSGSAIARGQRASSAANAAALPTTESLATGPSPWNRTRNRSAAERTGRSEVRKIGPAFGWSRQTWCQSSPDSSRL